MKKKAQLSIEFIIIFCIVIVLFVFLSLLFLNKYVILQNKLLYFSADDVCKSLSFAVDNVYFSNEGVSTKVYIPRSLVNDMNYSVYFYPGAVIVSYGLREDYCPILLNLNSNLTEGAWNKITKTSSGVKIEN